MVRDIIRLMEILSFLYMTAAVYNAKMKYNIYTVVLVMLELFILFGINNYGFSSYLLVFSYLLMFIYCLINYEASLKETIVNGVLVVIGISTVQMLCYFAVSFVDTKLSLTVEQRELVVSILYFMIVFAFSRKMHLPEISAFFIKRNALLYTVGGFILVILGSQLWGIKKENFIDGKYILSATFFVLFLMLMIWEWQKTRSESEKRKMQLELNRIYYEAYEGLIQSIRERQHDFKNHLNALEGMIYSIDNYDELVLEQKKYLQSIMGELEPARLLTLIENPLIAGFLNYKVSKAQEMGITTRYHCVLQKRDMGIPEFKLIEMMGILLDNAIEELSSESIADRVLVIELMVEDNIMKFAVSNSYENNNNLDVSKIFENGYSSKGNGRGIGLSKLKHMMKDNNGEIAVSQEVFENIPVLKIEWLIGI